MNDPKQKPPTVPNGNPPVADREEHATRKKPVSGPAPAGTTAGSYYPGMGTGDLGREPYGGEGPPTVNLRFPLAMLRVLEKFGSRFFEYSHERHAYVGRPSVAPEICRLIAGDPSSGQRLMREVEDAYAEYIAVPSSVDQPAPKPIP